jgi:hypothetical protein
MELLFYYSPTGRIIGMNHSKTQKVVFPEVAQSNHVPETKQKALMFCQT